ncbi:TIGR01777 family oxidoreductase [Tenacibaculum sp. M341]|uniref:TIGR01777 family oxidoreductase n=1 Tax=Tenacibaculum sp. M341 TaxID=2530339 RepID=UPI001047101F|nr:TIGR01777 family oxidoreductase [Tenacibaculum sp. M341]TCI85182.1 TIGR01777 family protein [Tenacibaculum sp. M341]
MKIVIAGGTGYLGELLTNYYKKEKKNQIYILTRKQKLNSGNVHYLQWNGKTKGYWTSLLEHTDVLINLTGKSVNCRYTKENKEEIYQSRLQSTALLCEIVQELAFPPKVFIQSSSATIYRHSEDVQMTEEKGEIGIDFSMDVCKKWEEVFNNYEFSKTKKIITRTSIVLGSNGGAFPIMKKMTKLGLGGKQGKGNQFISWITEKDYIKAIDFLMTKKSGVYNICVPNPIRNKEFQKELRKKIKAPFGLSATKWMLKIGAKIIGTETELLLKSRNVYPEKLLDLGFEFDTKTFKEFSIQ